MSVIATFYLDNSFQKQALFSNGRTPNNFWWNLHIQWRKRWQIPIFSEDQISYSRHIFISHMLMLKNAGKSYFSTLLHFCEICVVEFTLFLQKPRRQENNWTRLSFKQKLDRIQQAEFIRFQNYENIASDTKFCFIRAFKMLVSNSFCFSVSGTKKSIPIAVYFCFTWMASQCVWFWNVNKLLK